MLNITRIEARGQAAGAAAAAAGIPMRFVSLLSLLCAACCCCPATSACCCCPGSSALLCCCPACCLLHPTHPPPNPRPAPAPPPLQCSTHRTVHPVSEFSGDNKTCRLAVETAVAAAKTRFEAGICVRCPCPTVPGSYTCPEHLFLGGNSYRVNPTTLRRSYAYAAERRGLDFLLTEGEFAALTRIPATCHYCGEVCTGEVRAADPAAPPQLRLRTGGVDRLDSSKGYTKPNAVTCCWDCNGAKMALTVPDFAAKVQLILDHQQRPSPWARPLPRLVTLPDLEARARANAKKAVTMTAAQVDAKVKLPCVYCGVTPAGGLDRIDSSKGYSPANTDPCCRGCNTSKVRAAALTPLPP